MKASPASSRPVPEFSPGWSCTLEAPARDTARAMSQENVEIVRLVNDLFNEKEVERALDLSATTSRWTGRTRSAP